MRVITEADMPRHWQTEMDLADAVRISESCVDFDNPRDVAEYLRKVAGQNADLIALLVEKGVLTLGDCRAVGGSHMEEVE